MNSSRILNVEIPHLLKWFANLNWKNQISFFFLQKRGLNNSIYVVSRHAWIKLLIWNISSCILGGKKKDTTKRKISKHFGQKRKTNRKKITKKTKNIKTFKKKKKKKYIKIFWTVLCHTKLNNMTNHIEIEFVTVWNPPLLLSFTLKVSFKIVADSILGYFFI